MDQLHEKNQKLQELLQQAGSIAIAFSSGVDSTFLLKAAHEALGERACAITAKTGAIPIREFKEAEEFCRTEGIRHFIAEIDEMSIESFVSNPPDRCYHCKKALFSAMKQMASEQGYAVLAEGSNTDDVGDYRPGMKAIAELRIMSPLREAGLSKSDIRILSKEMNLPTWDKPSFACLASRFVYGEQITKEKLLMVDRAEQVLLDHVFSQFRVRMHGNVLARIEVLPDELPKLMAMKEMIDASLKEIGFLYVAAELSGYKMGSMNAGLDIEKTEQS